MFREPDEVLQRTQWHKESGKASLRTWQHGIALKPETWEKQADSGQSQAAVGDGK